jgi:hypothetical protein
MNGKYWDPEQYFDISKFEKDVIFCQNRINSNFRFVTIRGFLIIKIDVF